MRTKKPTPDEQVEELVGLMRFMTWKKLAGVPHQWVEDYAQDITINFLITMRAGKIKAPKSYLYFLIRGKCADFLDERKDPTGFLRWRRYSVSLSSEISRDEDDDDGIGLTMADIVSDPDPWSNPAFSFKHGGDFEAYLELQERLDRQRRQKLRKVVREVMVGEPSADLWGRKAKGGTYAEIAKAVGLTPGQVRGRLTRSAPRLRRQLRRLGYLGH